MHNTRDVSIPGSSSVSRASAVGQAAPRVSLSEAERAMLISALPTGAYVSWGKRLLDLVLTLVAGTLVLPLVPLIALAIRLDSPGPVLYRSIRLGRHG
ncbi:MAG TPA: sugar transferase, partial [Candidatus Eisenbacteria bacterium]|nr:sugar transferase [Candidatus Eisenbacteria bacterium]